MSPTEPPAHPSAAAERPPIEDIAALRLSGELGWRAAVQAVTAQIPAGQVLSYGDVAAILGAPRAARQVGYALAALSPIEAERLPWWRVLRGDGSIALQGDPERGPIQAARLRADGVVVQDYRVSMAERRWTPGRPA
jgi:methylated-DNA-protein-cysteine methyltransferase-like protein